MRKNGKPAPPVDSREAAQIGPRQLKDPQSVEFAWQTLAFLKDCWQYKEYSDRGWEKTLEEADRFRIYDRVPPEKPYGSLDAMLQAEIGETAATATAKVAERAQMFGKTTREASDPKGGRPGKVDQKEKGLPLPKGSRTAARRVARLKRDHPDIAVRLAAGEFRSVAAAVRASKGEDPHPLRRVKTPLEKAKDLLRRLTAEERQELLACLQALQG